MTPRDLTLRTKGAWILSSGWAAYFKNDAGFRIVGFGPAKRNGR